MSDAERLELLRQIHRGRVSRNRAFEALSRPEALRVLRTYRTLRDLLRDLGRPGVSVRVRELSGSGSVAVAVVDSSRRYRRIAVLPRWAQRFWTSDLGAPPLEPAAAPEPPSR